MSFRAAIDLVLPSTGLIRLTKQLDGLYEDLIEIMQVGLAGTGDTASVVGSIAQHFDDLPQYSGERPEWSMLISVAIYGSNNFVIIKYSYGGLWRVATVRRDTFIRFSAVRIWGHIRTHSEVVSHGN